MYIHSYSYIHTYICIYIRIHCVAVCCIASIGKEPYTNSYLRTALLQNRPNIKYICIYIYMQCVAVCCSVSVGKETFINSCLRTALLQNRTDIYPSLLQNRPDRLSLLQNRPEIYPSLSQKRPGIFSSLSLDKTKETWHFIEPFVQKRSDLSSSLFHKRDLIFPRVSCNKET